MSRGLVLFICTQFGPLPPTWPAFLLSCEKNPEFEWLIVCDKEISSTPQNVRSVRMTFEEYLGLVSERVGFQVNKGPYSACDIRPAFGVVFEAEIAGYDFWGHADLDVVWGRLEIFLSARNLRRYDVISSRRSYVAGHCTVYRNCDRINRLYTGIPNFEALLADPRFCHVDEIRMSSLLRKTPDVRVFWFAQHVVDQIELSRRPFGWRWENGRILDQDHVERAYIHFGTLKRTLNRVEFTYEQKPERFVITPRGLFWNKSPFLLDNLRIPPFAWQQKRAWEAIRRVLTGRERR